jgi:nucleotide-binding universal stress UspA family protein
VDFDESSAAVLHFAREIAQQNGATLCALHVAPLPLNATEFIPMDLYPLWEKPVRAELATQAAAHLEGRSVAFKIERRSGEAPTASLCKPRKWTPTSS